MDLRNVVLRHGMKLMSNPRTMRLMQDERLLKTMMTAMSVPGRVSSAVQEHTERLAHLLSFATEREVRDLRRTVRSLEDQIADIKRNTTSSQTSSSDPA